MIQDHFDEPVRVNVSPRGNIVNAVSSAREAAEMLLNHWPAPAGAKHLAARKACLAVLQGAAEARRARKAFEAAAKEAGVYVEPPTPVTMEGRTPKLWRSGRSRKLKRDM